MSAPRFEIGEIAIYAVARDPSRMRYVGEECTVRMIGDFRKGEIVRWKGHDYLSFFDGNYVVEFSDGAGSIAMDWQLQKKNPPEEPEQMVRHEEEGLEAAA